MTRLPKGPEIAVDCLRSLGITRYEALVYIALLKVPSATASEIHESSGVPRASVYPVLDQLQDKELVTVSFSSPKRFAAIPPDKAIARLMSRIERDAATAEEGLTAIFRQRAEPDGVAGELIWNLYGITAIRKKLMELISGAEEEIRIIAHARVFTEDVKEALSRQGGAVSTEIITSHWDGAVPASVRLCLNDLPALPKELDQIREGMAGGICIVDGRRAMVILGSEHEDAVALFSESGGFVRFFLRYYSLILDGIQGDGDQ
jgi:sugar-specific transcriptional regulator TrmB